MKWILALLAVLAATGGAAWWLFGPAGVDTPGADTAVAPAGKPWFREVTKELGLNFVHKAGGREHFMPRINGSGGACFDFDNDGRLDIYLLQNGGPDSGAKNALFRQLEDGTFKDVSAGSGLDINGYNMGVAIADVNNDGLLDVLVTQYNGVKLFLNQGNGKFKDVTVEAGLSNPSWGVSAAFFDYDRDGWLDLVIVCYLAYDPTVHCKNALGNEDFCAPHSFPGRVSRLFHNVSGKSPAKAGTPTAVRFEDVTVTSGLGGVAGPGLGVLCADFDGDGWPDIFISNDGAPNHLWINRHDGTFKEEAVMRGIAYNGQAQAQAGMGIAYGDVNGDGLLDIFVTHLGVETHALWSPGPRGVFADRTAASGLLQSHWRGTGFGTLFADFDLDGSPDLAVVNGRVTSGPKNVDQSLGFWGNYAERNQLFANDGTGQFRDISLDNPDFSRRHEVSRGLIRGDFNNDGAPDLLVTTIEGPARLFYNVASERGHWLIVRAFDPALKRDALGSEVRVWAGKRSWVQWLHPAESYLSSSEPRAHFGLGKTEKIDHIDVRWPDGSRERFSGCPVDQRIEVRKGQGHKMD